MEVHGIELVGALTLPVRTVTASATVNAADVLIVVNNGAANVTLTIPSAAGNVGRTIIIKRGTPSTGTVTVNAGGSQVEALTGAFGATTTIPTTSAQRGAFFISDGTRWLRITG